MERKTLPAKRGSALVTSMTVLFAVFVIGSGILSLGLQSMRRGQFDSLRTRALAIAEGGGEKALHYLRTTAPNGTTDGSWRTTGWTEYLDGSDYFTIRVQNGQGSNAGRIVITSTGRASDGMYKQTRSVRVVAKITREDISIWNNAIFGGVGQAGRSINGNIRIRGSTHLLGDGEPFTDLDNDKRWDAGETYTDLNHNGAWNIGEPFVDLDGDGRFDVREPYDDVNGNGYRDPPLTVTDLASELGGDANIGNNYAGMPSDVRSLLPAIPTTSYKGEVVDTLSAKLRVKHGRVNINGSATVGDSNVAGGSPPVKESVDATHVSDGFGGNSGTSNVFSDNGYRSKYDLGDILKFPTLTAPTTKSGVAYATYMDYLRAAGMVVTGPLKIQVGTAYGPVSDGRGNSLSVDTSGNINIQGIIYVDGDIEFNRNGGNQDLRYRGRGTFVSTGKIQVSTHLLPGTATFPINHALGVIARRKIELATRSGDSQLKLTGAFYAQERIESVKQNELAGTFVTSYFEMQNVPHMYQVPTLPDNLPPGMPGSERIWIKSVRIDSWREL